MSWLDQFAAPGSGDMPGMGATPVNVATGKFVIDTNDLVRAKGVVTSLAREMGRAMQQDLGGGTTAGVKEARGALSSLEASMESTLRSASKLSVGLTLLGTKNAQSVKQLMLTFEALSGSEEKATQNLAALRQMAEDTNQPFLEMVQGATGLLPAMRGTNAELTTAISLAQRLAIMDPAQGIAGASFAIREFLNGEYISLTRRLELDRTRLRDILEQADGDAQAALVGLDQYISEIGLTQQKLIEMGQSGVNAFRVTGSELKETTAQYFEPFLNDVILPIVKGFGDLARELRGVNPELRQFVGISAGLLGVAGLGTVALPGGQKIPGGAALSRIGVGAAAVYGGAQLGATISRAAGLEGTQGQSNTAIINQALQTAGQMVVVATDTIGNLVGILQAGGFVVKNAFGVIEAALLLGAAQAGNGLASLVDVVADAGAGLARTMAGFMAGMSHISLGSVDAGPFGSLNLGTIDLGTAGLAEDLNKLADNLEGADNKLRTSDSTMEGYVQTIQRGIGITQDQGAALDKTQEKWDAFTLSLGQALGVIDETRAGISHLFSNVAQYRQVGESGPSAAFTDEQFQAWLGFQDDLAKIETDRQDALLENQQNYEEQLTQDDEDFQRARTRAAEKLTQDIDEIHAAADERAIESEQTRDATIGTLREKAAQAELEQERDYQREREKMERDHRDKLRDAALHLDASAIQQEQQRYGRQLEEQDIAEQEERAKRAEQLAERIQQEQAAHEDRLAAGRKADDKRIADLRARYADEQRLAAENRRIERERQQAAYQKRIEDINTHAGKEYTARENAFINEYNQLASHESQKLGLQQLYQNLMLSDFETWLQGMRGKVLGQDAARAAGIATGRVMGAVTDATRLLGFRAGGGDITATGAWGMHAGEYAFSAPYANMLRRMMGGQISQPAVVASVAHMASGGGANGAPVINIIESQNSARTLQLVRSALLEVYGA